MLNLLPLTNVVPLIHHLFFLSTPVAILHNQNLKKPSIARHIKRIKPPVDLHCFFEISIRTEKKISFKITEKKIQLVYN